MSKVSTYKNSAKKLMWYALVAVICLYVAGSVVEGVVGYTQSRRYLSSGLFSQVCNALVDNFKGSCIFGVLSVIPGIVGFTICAVVERRKTPN